MKQESLLQVSGKLGLKGVMYFSTTLFLFAFMNLSILTASIFLLRSYLESTHYAISLIGIFILGVAFSALAIYMIYKYLIIESLSLAYNQLTPFLQRFSNIIAEKTTIAQGGVAGKGLDTMVNTDAVLTEVYGSKVPRLIRKAIKLVLGLIPFAPILLRVKDKVAKENRADVGVVIFEEIDYYIQHSIFNENSMKGVGIIYLANMLVQAIWIGVLVYFF